MGEADCDFAGNFHLNHSHSLCALVVAQSVRAGSILDQQPVELLGDLALGTAAARPGNSLALVAPAQSLAQFLGR
jgi:hypothetical protein